MIKSPKDIRVNMKLKSIEIYDADSDTLDAVTLEVKVERKVTYYSHSYSFTGTGIANEWFLSIKELKQDIMRINERHAEFMRAETIRIRERVKLERDRLARQKVLDFIETTDSIFHPIDEDNQI